MNQVLKRQDVRDRLVASGLEIVGSSAEDFRPFRQSDFEKWGRIVTAANINLEP